MRNRFVMVDGLDGSGKGVIVNALARWAEGKGLKVLDLKEYCTENKTLPEPEEITEFDAIRSDEPTYSFVGLGIRDEMIKDNNRKYSALSVAHAFALDREILYRRVIIPAMKAGKYIFQERGVTSSLVYQPVQERLQLSELMKLPGNRLALENAPGLLIITKIEPETVIRRLQGRSKRDDSIFENLTFQRKLEERYSSEWLRNLFERFGSKVTYLNTDDPRTVEDTKVEAVRVWEEFVSGKKESDNKSIQ